MSGANDLQKVNIVLVCGHYGSGKTNVAIGLAEQFNREGRPTALVDLDIVNPYFRSADATERLEALGIRCINPQYANTNVDVPSLGADIHAVFASIERNPRYVAIFDIGGNNGSVALGRFAEMIRKHPFAMLYVANQYRPLTATVEATLEDLREVEYYARLSCTHIVNNSNLGYETEESHVSASTAYIRELSARTGLPCLFTSVFEPLASPRLSEETGELFVIPDSTKKLF